MKTDDLIRTLSEDRVQEPSTWKSMLVWVIPAGICSLFLLLASLGPRVDLAAALGNPVSVMRYVLSGLLAVISARAVLSLARPEADLRAVWPVLIVPAIAVALWVWAWVGVPAEGRQMAIVGKTMVTCLVTIPILSILPVGAIFIALRGAAPTVPAKAGALAGLTGGGLAAAIYAIHCTEDSPLFYVTWYGLAILFVTSVSALLGARLLRW
ncbi:NrsF family protein [Thioclava sp. FR2]|uniref:NrsF family protein n=1 Tax=Thioclava sp. FR2 TaxID=3445780 RepID=UPI003EB71723